MNTNYILPVAAFIAGYFIANRSKSSIGSYYDVDIFADAKILSKQQKTTMYVVTRTDGENVVVPLDDISFEQAAYPGIKIIAIYNKGLPVFTPNFAMQK